MPLEQEVRGLIIFGFILVLLVVGFSIFLLFLKIKNKGLLWFIPQLLMLILCLYFFLRLTDNVALVSSTMISEENSLMVGLLGVSWGFSMMFMTIGILKSLKNKSK